MLFRSTRASSGTYVGSDGLINTAATNEPRFDHNPTTGESLGLLVEEQRTNLLLNSATLSTQSVTVTAAAHTLSFSGTGTITLSGTSTAGPLVGTGTGEANRVSLTFTPTAGSLTLTVTGTVSNAQLELGAFKTSYIPTTAAAATRSADVCSISGSNFSSWYNSIASTVYAEYATANNVSGSFPAIASLSNGASTNRLQISHNSGVRRAVVTSGGVSQWDVQFSAVTANAAGKFALTAQAADFAAVNNGGTVSAQTSGLMPTGVSQLGIGVDSGLAAPLSGTIRRLTYWPQRLPNSTLQTITQP